ncbi:hypothetical protein FGB62_87g058 [Gracilaria domingensis]|nr:hypothetical protein FGB62_87g058 [Gracilaria domingensis]
MFHLSITQQFLVLIGICSIIVQTSAQLIRAGCAPDSEVKEALHRAEQSASQWLGKDEARELIESLMKEGKRHSDGTICFSRSDFEHFGTLASQLYQEVEITDRQFRPEFSGAEQDESLGSSSQCVCLVCEESYVSYCDRSFRTKCCPTFCKNIFSAMAVAALSGVEGSGLESCCEDGSKPCPATKPSSRSRGKTRTKASEAPTFNFHRNAPSVLPGRAQPTVTPAVESKVTLGGLQNDDLNGQGANPVNEPTMQVVQDSSLSPGSSTSQPLHQGTDSHEPDFMAEEVGVTELLEDDDIPIPTAEEDV